MTVPGLRSQGVTRSSEDTPAGTDPVASGPPEADPVEADATAVPFGGTRLCIIVPAFNEGPSVAKVVVAIQSALPSAQVVVVDDGSKDDTSIQAADAGAHVITLPMNLGIGGAVQTGYLYAQRNDFDIAMQIDGDGQHDPREARFVIEPILEQRADMVVGSRWLGRGEYKAPSGRRLGMRILSRLIKWRTGQTITDTTSGFRAVGRPGIALFAQSYSSDFPEVEALVAAKQCGLVIEEVPVQMQQRLHGRSSIAGLQSSYYMMRVVVALVVDSLQWKEHP